MIEDKILKPGDVAKIFGVSSKTISRWAREGKVEFFVTIGGHRRFRMSEVNRIKEKMEK